LTGIGLVVVAHQVKNAMKDQNAHLIVEGATEAASVAHGDSGSDGDVAQIRRSRGRGPSATRAQAPALPAIPLRGLDGKRENVGRASFSAVRAVPSSDFDVRHKANRKRSDRQPKNPARAAEKPFEVGNRNANATLVVQDHESDNPE
jgi:hypothetical protein